MTHKEVLGVREGVQEASRSHRSHQFNWIDLPPFQRSSAMSPQRCIVLPPTPNQHVLRPSLLVCNTFMDVFSLPCLPRLSAECAVCADRGLLIHLRPSEACTEGDLYGCEPL